MSERFVVVDTATGEILREGWCGERMARQQARRAGELSIIAPREVTGSHHYRDPPTGEYRPRPSMDLVVDKSVISADGADEAIISGVPDGAEVRAAGQRLLNWTQGTFTVSSEQATRVVVTIRRFPYKDAVIKIEAIDGRP